MKYEETLTREYDEVRWDFFTRECGEIWKDFPARVWWSTGRLFTRKYDELRGDILLASKSGLAPASVSQLDSPSDLRPGGRGFNPCRGR